MKLGTSKVNPLWAIVLLGVVCSLIYASRHMLVVDAGQLLDRGYLFTQGELVPFGPRSSKTNFILGPVISVFSGAFVALGGSWGLLFGIGLTHLAGLWLLTKTRFLRFDATFYLCFLFLFWCSPWRASEVFIWNAAFLMPLSCLWLYGLDRCYRRDDFVGTLLMGIAVALTIQIHNSHLFLVILTLLLWWRKQIRVDLRAAALAVVLLAVMLVPTFVVLQRNPEILSMNQGKVSLFGNLLKGGEAIKGLLYWVRYPSLYFGATTFQLPKIVWATATLWEQVWVVVKWLFAVPSLVAVIYANWRFFRSPARPELRTLCLCAMASLVAVSALSPVPFNFWHLYLVYPFALIPVALLLAQAPRRTHVVAVLAAYFLVYSWGSTIHSHKHRADADMARDFAARVENPESLRAYFAPFALKLW